MNLKGNEETRHDDDPMLTANSFEVHELGGGTASLSFGYRITAIRRKYETVRFADHTNDPDPRKMLEHMRKAKPASSSDPVAVKRASITRQAS